MEDVFYTQLLAGSSRAEEGLEWITAIDSAYPTEVLPSDGPGWQL